MSIPNLADEREYQLDDKCKKAIPHRYVVMHEKQPAFGLIFGKRLKRRWMNMK